MTGVIEKGEPFLVSEHPISQEAAVPLEPGHVVEIGIPEDEPVMGCRGRLGWPFGWCISIKDSIARVGCGGDFLIWAWLAPGQIARKGDRLIVDSYGTLRVTDIKNEYPYKEHQGFLHPVVVGVVEDKNVQSGEKAEKILIRSMI
jgi:hypothetical protein